MFLGFAGLVAEKMCKKFGAKYTREALEHSKQSLVDHSDSRVEHLNADRDADIKILVRRFQGYHGLSGNWLLHLGRFPVRKKKGREKCSLGESG